MCSFALEEIITDLEKLDTQIKSDDNIVINEALNMLLGFFQLLVKNHKTRENIFGNTRESNIDPKKRIIVSRMYRLCLEIKRIKKSLRNMLNGQSPTFPPNAQ